MDNNSETHPDHHWNFRVATRLRINSLGKEWREFLYISAYYKKGVLNGHGISTVGDGFDELDSLKWTHGKLAEALLKDVIDLDNFPNVWEPEK